MLRKIAAVAGALAIAYAPGLKAEVDTNGIVTAAACQFTAEKIGLDADAKMWLNAAGALAAASGLPDFDRGYWVGIGIGQAMYAASVANGDRDALIAVYAQHCMSKGQAS